jgi:hypothetical protein
MQWSSQDGLEERGFGFVGTIVDRLGTTYTVLAVFAAFLRSV